MPRLTPREPDDFFAEPGVLMRVAVARADGSPLVTPLWFIHADDAIYFTPRALFRVALGNANVRTWRMPIGDEPGDGIWHQRYYATGSRLKRP